MCLDRLMWTREAKEFISEREGNHFVGYREFHDDGYYHLSSCFQGNGKKFKVERWLHERKYRAGRDKKVNNISMAVIYPMGFHIYLTPHPNRRKVYFRKVVAKGWELFDSIIVAKEMFILRKTRKKGGEG